MPLNSVKIQKCEQKTYIAIGDIHGCYKELAYLIEILESQYDLKDPKIQLVFLGDYIDRGDSSVMVIKKLLDIQSKYPQSIFLKGNHEMSFLEDQVRTFNDIPDPIPEYVLSFMNNLAIYYETPDFLFIHGGPAAPDSDLEKEGEHELLWNYIPDNQGWNGKMVVKGHTAVKRPTLLGNVLYLDSGCCFGGELSCAIIDAESKRIEEFKQIRRIDFNGSDRRKSALYEDMDINKVIQLKQKPA